jgi:hypothetical protein
MRRGGVRRWKWKMEEHVHAAACERCVGGPTKVCGDFLSVRCATMPSKVQGRGMRQIDV